jgi:hypothetical protein
LSILIEHKNNSTTIKKAVERKKFRLVSCLINFKVSRLSTKNAPSSPLLVLLKSKAKVRERGRVKRIKKSKILLLSGLVLYIKAPKIAQRMMLRAKVGR